MIKPKNFALIGASGYIAPRHFQAIKETKNNLVAILDRFDSVGVVDQYFPRADFFVEPERFDRHVEKLKHDKGVLLDYVSICTPNYLHDAHIRMSLRWGADAICEKPVVTNPWNINSLIKIEKETGRRIWNVLQLRLHKSIVELKRKIDSGPKDKIYNIDLTYLTSRGNWYYTSWKGDDNKSGGISTNIGVHFFDMLQWIFGDVASNVVHIHTHDRASGYLELKKARVRWFLSINPDHLPPEIKSKGLSTFRSIKIEDNEFEFSGGFSDLHTEIYKNILNGNGFSLEDTRKSIEIIHDIRNANPIGLKGDYHPYSKFKLAKHPFSD